VGGPSEGKKRTDGDIGDSDVSKTIRPVRRQGEGGRQGEKKRGKEGNQRSTCCNTRQEVFQNNPKEASSEEGIGKKDIRLWDVEKTHSACPKKDRSIPQIERS